MEEIVYGGFMEKAGPGGRGRIHIKLSRRWRLGPEGAQLTNLLGTNKGQEC